jgi:hypothetical protein
LIARVWQGSIGIIAVLLGLLLFNATTPELVVRSFRLSLLTYHPH